MTTLRTLIDSMRAALREGLALAAVARRDGISCAASIRQMNAAIALADAYDASLSPTTRVRSLVATVDQSTSVRRFTVFRMGDLSSTHNADQANDPNEPQFEGIVFTDGTTVIRWLTAVGSTCVFNDFESMWRIHGHNSDSDHDSAYETVILWHDDVDGAPHPPVSEPEFTRRGSVLRRGKRQPRRKN